VSECAGAEQLDRLAHALRERRDRGRELSHCQLLRERERNVFVFVRASGTAASIAAITSLMCTLCPGMLQTAAPSLAAREGFQNSDSCPEMTRFPGETQFFTSETAQQLREQSEDGLADVVEQAARDGARPPAGPHQLYLLSAPGDERTITLEHPIVHAPSGPGSGVVRGQRYTSLAALKQQPRTTAELVRYERENCFTRANTTTRGGLCVRRAASRARTASQTRLPRRLLAELRHAP
jgi:hypothetical protein